MINIYTFNVNIRKILSSMRHALIEVSTSILLNCNIRLFECKWNVLAIKSYIFHNLNMIDLMLLAGNIIICWSFYCRQLYHYFDYNSWFFFILFYFIIHHYQWQIYTVTKTITQDLEEQWLKIFSFNGLKFSSFIVIQSLLF